VEEVLDRQDLEVRSFLLQASIPTRLSGPLCDEVAQRHDGEAMLEYMDKRHLFVLLVNDGSGEYVYHAMFAAFLRRGVGEWSSCVGDRVRAADTVTGAASSLVECGCLGRDL